MAKAPVEEMSRAPFPDPESIPEEDRSEYDYVYGRVQKLTGNIQAFPYVGACLNSPPFAASLWRFSGRMLAAFTTSDDFSHKDREYINLVLAFDYGSTTMLHGHFDYAVQVAGISPETIKSLWDGRDDDLASDERQIVDYIRAYVNGTVTDEMWSGIVERFGGVRGAVEYSLTIGYNLLCARSMQAFGILSPSREELEQMVQNARVDEELGRQMAAADPMSNPELLAEMIAG